MRLIYHYICLTKTTMLQYIKSVDKEWLYEKTRPKPKAVWQNLKETI